MTPDVQYTRLLKTFNADSHLVCRRRSSFSSSCGISLPQQNNNLQIDQSIPLESKWELACVWARVCVCEWADYLFECKSLEGLQVQQTDQKWSEVNWSGKRGKSQVMSRNVLQTWLAETVALFWFVRVYYRRTNHYRDWNVKASVTFLIKEEL